MSLTQWTNEPYQEWQNEPSFEWSNIVTEIIRHVKALFIADNRVRLLISKPRAYFFESKNRP